MYQQRSGNENTTDSGVLTTNRSNQFHHAVQYLASLHTKLFRVYKHIYLVRRIFLESFPNTILINGTLDNFGATA